MQKYKSKFTISKNKLINKNIKQKNFNITNNNKKYKIVTIKIILFIYKI